MSGQREFITVDVQAVEANNPQSAVRRFVLKGKPRVIECDVAIIGGGMGGVAAAIRACKLGLDVCLTEETDWLGGQMTSQGVSALDENYLVETSGATALYQKLRELIRQHYRPRTVDRLANGPVDKDRLNPGLCWVTRLSFEPEVGLAKLEQLIADEVSPRQRPRVMLRSKVVALNVSRGRIRSALALNLDSGKFVEIRAKFFLDATELGDMLPLAGVPYASGAESRLETGEPHAPESANYDNVQDFTYPFVIEYREGENHTIAKPPAYDRFAQSGKFTFAGYKMFANAKRPDGKGEFLPFWTYRRLIAAELFKSDFPRDLSMINWDSNDLRGENLIDAAADIEANRLALGKNISLSFLYWLQTAAPRDDGGTGYPELKLLPQPMGTKDGLSKYPYIRESRRIKAKRIVVEQDIAEATTSGARARLFQDSVGIGLYPIDIHGQQDVPGAGQASRPFQIPLSALVQNHVRNLIPACKNIGTTHVTNGAYRLHPIEWAIGEAAGELAGICVERHTTPARVLINGNLVRELQRRLVAGGAPIFWFDDVPTSHPNFAAIQYFAVAEKSVSNEHLHFEATDLEALQRRYDRINKGTDAAERGHLVHDSSLATGRKARS